MKGTTDGKDWRSWRIIRIGWVVWMLLLTVPVLAQTEPEAGPVAQSQPAPDDRSAIRVRQPARNRVEAYRNDRDYQYGQDVAPATNPWSRFWAWLFRKISSFFTVKSYQNFWQYVLLALVAALVVWLLIKPKVSL